MEFKIKKIGMFMAMLWMSISAIAYDFEVDNVFYTVLSVPELTVEVTASPDKYQGTISIPETVEWSGRCFNVISIGSKAFYDCSELKEIHIPRSVKSIGLYAFYKTKLEKVHLKDVESWLKVDIKCDSWTNGVAVNGSPFCNGAFLCINEEIIENLIIPEGIKSLNSNFSGCGSIRTALLPESCTYLCESFAKCKNLESIEFKGTNIEIGAYTFSYCDKMLDFDFLDKCCSLSSNALSHCNMAKLSIPNIITSIGKGLCEDCENLEYCSIGNGISELPFDSDEYHGDPFYGTSRGMNMFDGCENLKVIDIVDSAHPLDVYNCGYDDSFVIEKTRFLGSFARFNLDSISINRDLSYIDSSSDNYYYKVYAPFAGCRTLKKAYIGGASTIVGEDFFRNCCSLECVTFGENITKIDGSVFYNCDNLKQIMLESTIPPSFTSGAFSHSQLLSIKIIVPDGCVDTYMQTKGWKEFLNIVDETSAGIDEIRANDSDDSLVVNEEGIIYIGESVEDIYVYGIDGRLIHSAVVIPNQSIALPNGMYVVRIKNKSFKVKI